MPSDGGVNLYVAQYQDGSARLGSLSVPLRRGGTAELQTPHLLPVVNLLTGTTPYGGGIWRYILRSLFRSNSPMMTQALQFLDFHLTPAQLNRWVGLPGRTVMDQYMEVLENESGGPVFPTGPVFMDSGGYKFLANPHLDLSGYGIRPFPQGWREILAIQDGIGGDVYLSLDYPVKPGLVDAEARQHISRTLGNAIRTLRTLSQRECPRPPLFVPVHGRSQAEARRCVQSLYHRLDREGLRTDALGISVGSLVPLRTSNRYEALVGIIEGVREGVPESLRAVTPIHVLGITGTMLPVLAYLGVDLFDSSTYVQSARSLEYYHPEHHVKVRFLELDGRALPCDCPFCADQSFRLMHRVLVHAPQGAALDGMFRSEAYARVALHNLHWDQAIVTKTQEAIKADALEEYLVEHARLYPTIRPAIRYLGATRNRLAAALTRSQFVLSASAKAEEEMAVPSGPLDLCAYDPGPPPWQSGSEAGRTVGARTLNVAGGQDSIARRISLKYTPDSFTIPDSWVPDREKDVLLLLACSGVKPYSDSRTHQAVKAALEERLGAMSRVQKVTLSGLYGPVPAEFELLPPVLEYDFHLSLEDEAQVQLCARRLIDFLAKHKGRFICMVGYATARAYREVMLRAAATPGFAVLPQNPVRQQLTELFRRSHLDALAETISRKVLEHEGIGPKPFTA